jgi:hypothetical protein
MALRSVLLLFVAVLHRIEQLRVQARSASQFLGVVAVILAVTAADALQVHARAPLALRGHRFSENG